jgi:GTP cyclohydrolase I
MNGREDESDDLDFNESNDSDFKLKRLTNLMSQVLYIINPNADEKILQKTPERFSKALLEFVDGYQVDLEKLLNDAIFDSEGYDDLVIVKNIEFTSLCEHHMLPFFGKCTIGYYPRDKILGLSKFPRLVGALSKKMHLQERLTKEIAEAIDKYLNPLGVVVAVSSSHSCMCFRGIKSFNSQTDTIYSLGILKEKDNLNKFFSLISCYDNKK